MGGGDDPAGEGEPQRTDPKEPTDDPDSIATEADLVLNGAQITAAVDIVAKVTAGEVPRDTGVQMLQAFFNIAPKQAESIMGTAGTKTPTTPNPNPAVEKVKPVADAA